MRALPRNTVLVGDVRERLAELPNASVDCVITSPPFFQLRDYGVAGQMGLEPTVDEWVDELRVIMRGVARVLKPTGSLWLNLGDSYSRHARFGAPPKSLLLAPERLALALVADGWTLRNKVIWSKSNGMPNSVQDRLSCRWEVVYFFTRQRQYVFDLGGIRIPHRSATTRRPLSKPNIKAVPAQSKPPTWAGPLAGNNSGLARLKKQGLVGHPLGKNPGDVWTMAASNFRGPHFATFPLALVERPLLATCPERVCTGCGAPWIRVKVPRHDAVAQRGELHPGCRCRKGWQPGLVLDPFMGTGTVGIVAEQHEREWLGVELNPKFAALANERIAGARNQRSTDQGRRRAA